MPLNIKQFNIEQEQSLFFLNPPEPKLLKLHDFWRRQRGFKSRIDNVVSLLDIRSLLKLA